MEPATNEVLCAFCGVNPGTEPEHVFARALNDGLAEGLITVPACRECNVEKSKADEYLRDILVGDMRVDHPVARRIYEGKVQRSLARDRSTIPRYARRRAEPQPIPIPGPPVAIIQAVPVYPERIWLAISWIVRGLHYYVFQQRLPDDYTIDVKQLHASEVAAERKPFTEAGCKPNIVTREIAGYMYFALEHQGEAHWLIWFYKSTSHAYKVVTRPAIDEDVRGSIAGVQSSLWGPVNP